MFLEHMLVEQKFQRHKIEHFSLPDFLHQQRRAKFQA
jgi:hypothetical protein